MARILCTWELGSGLGHLSHLRLAIEIALDMGHEVYLAARELERVKAVLGELAVVYLQAPFKQNAAVADQAAFPSYTHLLARQCFSGVDELEIYLRAWRALFELVRPSLVMFEHSPSALIAAHACAFKKVLVGNGFFIPPMLGSTSAPFAPFVTTPRSAEVLAGLRSDDAVLLKVINLALNRLGSADLPSLPDIYAQADEQFLMTLPALDHFGERVGQRYLGVEPLRCQHSPHWPPGPGCKVFAYLHAMPSLEILLRELQAAKVCALLHVRGLAPAVKDAFTSEQLHFTEQLVDLTLVAEHADWVISHGNHNTVAHFVRSGIPQLLLPRHQEHLFTAMRLVAQGCAVMAYQDQASYSSEIGILLTSSSFRCRAAQVKAECPSPESLDAPGFIRHALHSLLAAA